MTQISFRVPDVDGERFLEIANREGFDSVQKWLIQLAEKRTRLVEEAINQEAFLEIDGKIIPFADLPDDIEIKRKKK